jgi:hypothetical protein
MHYVVYNETSRPDKNSIKEREKKWRSQIACPYVRVCLWLTLNLALIIQRLSWNNIYIYFLFYVHPKISSPTPGGTRTPGWIPLS